MFRLRRLAGLQFVAAIVGVILAAPAAYAQGKWLKLAPFPQPAEEISGAPAGVPILAGIDSKRMNPLWAPFLLFNVGCAGRVLLQVLTDFVPNIAYPLIGFTGFIELTALLW